MKKKFKKVVEWEEEPDSFSMYFGVMSLISAMGMWIIVLKIFYSLSDISQFILIFSMSLLFFIGLVFTFYLGKGKGRKVYWEEVK